MRFIKQRLLKTFKKPQALLVLLGTSLVSCGPNRPALSICFFSYEARAMKCTDPKGKDFECDLQCMDGYFGLSARDAESLLKYVTDLEKNQR